MTIEELIHFKYRDKDGKDKLLRTKRLYLPNYISSLKGIESMFNLERLFINDNVNLCIEDLENLTKLKGLKELEISNNKNITNLTKLLKNIPSIEHIRVVNTNITDLEFVYYLPNLKSLSTYNNNLPNELTYLQYKSIEYIKEYYRKVINRRKYLNILSI